MVVGIKAYKALIFDFDMTLADSSKVIYKLLCECSRNFGYEPRDFESTFPVIGNTHEIMLSHITGEKDPAKLRIMRDDYRRLCREKMAKDTQLFEDAPSLVRTAYEKGYKVGLLSLKLRDVLMQSLVAYGIDGCFSSVVGCEDCSTPKPDPSGLFVSLRNLGLEASEVLYVGDSLVDEGAARAAGVDFAAMLRGSTRKEQFDSSFVKFFYSTCEELEKEL